MLFILFDFKEAISSCSISSVWLLLYLRVSLISFFVDSIDETSLVERARADISVIATARDSSASSLSSSSDGESDSLLLRFERLGPSFDAWTPAASLPVDGPLRTAARSLQAQVDQLEQTPPALPSLRYETAHTAQKTSQEVPSLVANHFKNEFIHFPQKIHANFVSSIINTFDLLHFLK
jgi:hypothetical protein